MTAIGIDIKSCVKANDQRAIARFVSKATPKKVVESRAIRTTFEDRLDTLRGQWFFWKEQERLSVNEESGLSPMMIDKALNVITTEANELKVQLEGVQVFKTIGEMIREGDKVEELELLVIDMIQALRESLSIANNITPSQAADVAMMVIEGFPHLSFEEIAMCFHRAKLGEYGEIMHRLDGQVLLGWLNRFAKEMSLTAIEANSQEHKQFKRFEIDGKTSDLDLQKWLKVLPKAKDANKDLYKQNSLDNAAKQFFDGF